ncbi:MAG: hypothetical protein WCF57_09365 [Pyrinomonadaceae bacterium]
MSKPFPPSIQPEATFNEYVKEFGGELISELLPNNPNFDNADYLFRREGVVAELKCLEKDFFSEEEYRKKLNKLYSRWVDEGLAPIIVGRKAIQTKDLPLKCQHDVANIVKRPVENRIQKANKQIKQTKAHFGLNDAKGLLIMVNDGNYSLESDAVMYLVRRIVNTQCTAIDSTIYFTVNMPASMPGVERDILVWIDTHRVDPQNGVSREFLNAIREGWLSFLGRKTGEDIPVIRNVRNDDLENIKFIKEAKTAREPQASENKSSNK